MRVLFVCLGNICRSPTAEGVMRSLLDDAGLSGRVEVDSAGTGGWHVGNAPDPRGIAAAARRGIEVDGTARRLVATDLERFDLLLAMDEDNLAEMRLLAARAGGEDKLGLLRAYDPEAVAAGDLDVPDPYYGGAEGFNEVLDVVERACAGLLEEIEKDVEA